MPRNPYQELLESLTRSIGNLGGSESGLARFAEGELVELAGQVARQACRGLVRQEPEVRPGHVLCEFPLAEAEGILRRLDGDKSVDPHAASGRSRLQTAVNIEKGPGGSAEEVEVEMGRAA